MIDDRFVLEVGSMLKEANGCKIKTSTIRAMQDSMILRGAEVTTKSLYLECISNGIEHLIELDSSFRFYLIGIDGRKTPDPAYWFDRWECIEADSENIAKEKYYAKYLGWLRPEEKICVRVHAVSKRYENPSDWAIRTGYFGLADPRD